MSFVLPKSIAIVSEERRTCCIQVAAYGLTGDGFSSVNFLRESVFFDTDGNEVKRVQDAAPFEFTPKTISDSPELAQALSVIYRYLDGADQMRLMAMAQGEGQ